MKSQSSLPIFSEHIVMSGHNKMDWVKKNHVSDFPKVKVIRKRENKPVFKLIWK